MLALKGMGCSRLLMAAQAGAHPITAYPTIALPHWQLIPEIQIRFMRQFRHPRMMPVCSRARMAARVGAALHCLLVPYQWCRLRLAIRTSSMRELMTLTKPIVLTSLSPRMEVRLGKYDDAPRVNLWCHS